MFTVIDVLLLVGFAAFVLGGSTAMHWAFGVGIVAPPREYRERLKSIAWIPTVVAASGLLMSALTAPTEGWTFWHIAGCILLAVGLSVPAATKQRHQRTATHTSSSARRPTPRIPGPLSMRTLVLGAGYAAGLIGWFVALAVASGEVVESGDGWAADGGVGSVVMVEVDPCGQGGAPGGL